VWSAVGPGSTVVVVSGHETFASVRRALVEAPTSPVGVVVHGAGEYFASAISFVRSLDRTVERMLYFGDLDASDLRTPILAAHNARVEGLPAVEPATALYELLLRHGQPSATVPCPLTEAHALVTWLANWTYWSRPVPGFGDPVARMVVLGLAPAAHGANRTGRMFTGDRSGAFLYGALHRTGFASQPTSRHRDDGQRLRGCWVTAAVRCAPPQNRPRPDERDRCLRYLDRELALLPARVLVALGGFAWDAVLRTLAAPRPKPRFSHGATASVAGRTMIGSYHPSQQNTFTGRLTPDMLDAILVRARELARD
jgi:uracil-DNA glycosylase family 4